MQQLAAGLRSGIGEAGGRPKDVPGNRRYVFVFYRKLAASCLFMAVSWASDAPPSDVQKIKDLNIEDLLEVKAVSAVRHDQRQLDSPRSMSVITGEELRRRNFRTVPEALQGLAGVMVQETNYAGGSPIIRGMVGNRILILVDGMRLN